VGDLIQFVDKIDANPTVLLDINDDQYWATTLFAPAPPLLRRASTGGLLADGDVDAASVRADRIVTFSIDLVCPDQDTKATQLQRLARLIDRESSWLRYRPINAPHPVFFRLKRGDVAELTSNDVQVATLTGTVTMSADPYAYGLRVSGTASVKNDPTDASFPMSFELNDVRGDAPTLPRLQIAGTLLSSIKSRSIRVASTSGSRTGVLTAEAITQAATGWTMSTETGVPSADGGSFVRWTAGNSSGRDTVLTGYVNLPDVPPGEYRVLLRAGANLNGTSSGGTFGVPGSLNRQPAANGGWRWIDLGIQRLPQGGVPTTAFPPDVAETGFARVFFEWRGNSSAGDFVEVDQALLLPSPGPDVNVAGRSLRARASLASNSFDVSATLGGPAGIIGVGSASLPDANPWIAEGGMPLLVPGVKNRIYVLSTAEGVDDDSNTRVTNVSWSYYPRYLFARPAAS
jgi:hypothetical protein